MHVDDQFSDYSCTRDISSLMIDYLGPLQRGKLAYLHIGIVKVVSIHGTQGP